MGICLNLAVFYTKGIRYMSVYKRTVKRNWAELIPNRFACIDCAFVVRKFDKTSLNCGSIWPLVCNIHVCGFFSLIFVHLRRWHDHFYFLHIHVTVPIRNCLGWFFKSGIGRGFTNEQCCYNRFTGTQHLIAIINARSIANAIVCATGSATNAPPSLKGIKCKNKSESKWFLIFIYR